MQTDGFRCRVQALMTDALIQKRADRLWSDGAINGEISAGPVGWDLSY